MSAAEPIRAQRWVLVAHPVGAMEKSHFRLDNETVDLSKVTEVDASVAAEAVSNGRSGLKMERTALPAFETPSLCTARPNDIIVEVECLALDAFIRTMLNEDAYHGSVRPGSIIPALGYGTVIWTGSACSSFSVGDRVTGMLGAATHVRLPAEGLRKQVPIPGVPLSASLGVLGVVGITAYLGVFKVAKMPQKGETVVVSGAAGATGSIASQLCKTTGARVIGIAGGAHKARYLVEEMGLDGAVDYKDPERTVEEQLKEQCPNGIDFFYDNVGGPLLDVILNQINLFARVIICGAISQYNTGKLNTEGGVWGPSAYLKLAERSATMQGLAMPNHMSLVPEVVASLAELHQAGKVTLNEDHSKGIESFADALLSMFSGAHIGKKLVDIKEVVQP